MNFRHEVKHRISLIDMIEVRQRLRAVAKPDPYTIDGLYRIRSLYFDSAYDKALREKLDGVNMREKYRIRLYNDDYSLIRLERKFKLNNLGTKEQAYLSKDETVAIINGDIDWMVKSENKLIVSFYSKLKNECLKPKTIVDYTREPFIYAPGNVRVTFDYDIRTGQYSTDIFSERTVTIPVPDSPVLMEVKWDEFLPSIIRDAIQTGKGGNVAYSKYASCRAYEW